MFGDPSSGPDTDVNHADGNRHNAQLPYYPSLVPANVVHNPGTLIFGGASASVGEEALRVAAGLADSVPMICTKYRADDGEPTTQATDMTLPCGNASNIKFTSAAGMVAGTDGKVIDGKNYKFFRVAI